MVSGGQSVLEGNYDGSIIPGQHQRGTGVGAYEVLNQTGIPYDGGYFTGTNIDATPNTWSQEPYMLGEYQKFKRGGKSNYANYF